MRGRGSWDLVQGSRGAPFKCLVFCSSRVSCEYAGVQPSGLERCASLVSPCGGLVFAGTSRGTVHVWSADTGEHVTYIVGRG